MACQHQVGMQNLCRRAFPCGISGEEMHQKMQGNGLIELGAHGRTRTAGLLLTKEVLEDHFPNGARLRSIAEAFANNRCLAALPRKCHIFASVNPVDAQTCFARLSACAGRCHPVRIDRLSAIPVPLFGSAAPGQRGAARRQAERSRCPRRGRTAMHTTTRLPPDHSVVLLDPADLLSGRSPAGAPPPAGTEAGIAWSCVRCLPVPRPLPRSFAGGDSGSCAPEPAAGERAAATA
jgi:hypothetical protein